MNADTYQSGGFSTQSFATSLAAYSELPLVLPLTPLPGLPAARHPALDYPALAPFALGASAIQPLALQPVALLPPLCSYCYAPHPGDPRALHVVCYVVYCLALTQDSHLALPSLVQRFSAPALMSSDAHLPPPRLLRDYSNSGRTSTGAYLRSCSSLPCLRIPTYHPGFGSCSEISL